VSINTSKDWTSMFFGGTPHPWLTRYIEYSQKLAAYPLFFWSQAEINSLIEYKNELLENPEAKNPIDTSNGSSIDNLLAYVEELKENMTLEDGMDTFFGYNHWQEAPGDVDIGTFGTLYNSGRPPWVRMWTTISQHKRKYNETKGMQPTEETARRTYILSNDNPMWDYGLGVADKFMFDGNGEKVDNPYSNVTAFLDFEANEKLNNVDVSQDDGMYQYIPREGYSNNEFYSPNARIKDVSISVKGKYMGATKVCTVKFDVWNRKDFYNIYQRYFLVPGAQLVVDIGRTDVKPYDISEIVDLNNQNAIGNGLGALDQKLRHIRHGQDGKYNPASNDTFIGKVTKFDAKAQKDRFECSVTLVSPNFVSLQSDSGQEDGFSERFVNALDTYAVLSTVKQILPENFSKDIWNVNWLDTSGVDDITSLIGNTALSGQYVVKVDSENSDPVFTYGIHQVKLGESTVPITAPNTFSQEVGVYVQRLAASQNDGTTISSPKLNNNVYVSIDWIERRILNPLINDSAAQSTSTAKDDKDDKGVGNEGVNIFKGTFATTAECFCGYSTNLAKQRIFSKKTRNNYMWIYGSDTTSYITDVNQQGAVDAANDDSSETNPDSNLNSEFSGAEFLDTALSSTNSKGAVIGNLFVHSSIVKEALTIHTSVREIYLYILKKLNDSTDGFWDLQIVPTDGEGTGMKVIDINHDTAGLAILEESFEGGVEEYQAQYASAEESLYKENANFYESKPVLSPYTPGSIIKDIDFGFNIASNKMASMIAIQGASGNKMFSLNNAAAHGEFTGLRNLYKENVARPDYGWEYLPDTSKINKTETQDALDEYLVGWHEHVPEALNLGQLYQGFTEESKEWLKDNKIKELNGIDVATIKKILANTDTMSGDHQWKTIYEKVMGGDFSEDVVESWTPEKREELLKAVVKLDEDVLKKKEELYELDANAMTTEVIETDDGVGEKWVYARDLHHYYQLRHLKAISNNSNDGNAVPRYNPPVIGMELSLTLTGMFGWKIGDSFRLDELPQHLADKVYFIVTGVEHTINQSNLWETKLKCIYKVRNSLRFGKDMDFIPAAYKHTYIGISPGFVKSLGYPDIVAETLKRWKPGMGDNDFMNNFYGQYYEENPKPAWMEWDDIGVILFASDLTETLTEFLTKKEDGKHMMQNQTIVDMVDGAPVTVTDVDVAQAYNGKVAKVKVTTQQLVEVIQGEPAGYKSTLQLGMTDFDTWLKNNGYEKPTEAMSIIKSIDSDSGVSMTTLDFSNSNYLGYEDNFHNKIVMERLQTQYYAEQQDAYFNGPHSLAVQVWVPPTFTRYETSQRHIGIAFVDVITAILQSEWGQKSGFTPQALLDEFGVSEQRYEELLKAIDIPWVEEIGFNTWANAGLNSRVPSTITLPSDVFEFITIDASGKVVSIDNEYQSNADFTSRLPLLTGDEIGGDYSTVLADRGGTLGNIWSKSAFDAYLHINKEEHWDLDQLNARFESSGMENVEGFDIDAWINEQNGLIEEEAQENVGAEVKLEGREPNPYAEGTPAYKMYERGESVEEINKMYMSMCFDGFGKVLMADESHKLVKDIKIGDKVKSETGVATISKIDITAVDTFTDHYVDDEIKFYEYNDIQLTFGHWIDIDGEWIYPKNIKNAVLAKPKDTYMYNFHLEENDKTDLVYLDDELFPQFFGEKHNFYINDVLVSSTSDNVHKIGDYLDKLRVKYNISFLDANSENNTNLTNEEKEEVREEIKSFIKNLK
tara:strand:- start:6810 stop:12014 length:5205 start_codon:yes stop_codon:yes gene_type:complete